MQVRTKHAALVALAIVAVLFILLAVLFATPKSAASLNGASAGAAVFATSSETYQVSSVAVPSEAETRDALLARLSSHTDLSHDSLAMASHFAEEDAELAETKGAFAQGDVPVEVNASGRVFHVAKADGTEAEITLEKNPVRAAEPQELTANTIGVTLDGRFMDNGDAETYAALHGTDVLLGYALDGFGIYPDSGSTDLDACHGTSSTILWDGKLVDMYHYELSSSSPYVLGCFSGTPAPLP
jgi:hypothetical protein